MYTEISSSNDLKKLLESETAVMVYFSGGTCGVCSVIMPKVELAFRQHFPKIMQLFVKTDEHPELAGQHRIFALPSLLVFFEGRETIRRVRNFSVDELIHETSRPYSIMFPGK